MEKGKTQYLYGIVLSGGGNLLGMAASLVTIVVAARLLPQAELGAFFLVMLVVQFTAIFGDIGLKNTVIKTLSSLPAESTEFIQTSRYLLTVTLATSLTACIAVTLIMPLLTLLWPYQDFETHAFYVGPIAFLTTGLQIVTSFMVGAKLFGKLSILSAGVEILRALLSVGGLLAGLGISSLLWGMIVTRLIGIGAVWVLMPSLFALTFRHPQRAEFLKFGGWLYGGSLVSVIMVRVSDAILATYMGPAALAIYSAAMQVPSVLQRIFESIRPALLGYISAQQTAYANPQIAAVRIMTALLAIAATLLIALSQPLIVVLYSEKYESGVNIMQALSVWAAFAIINYLFSIILIGNGESKKAFLLTLPQLFTIVIFTSLLVPRYEGFGAAIALITTAFLGNIVGARMVAGEDKSACHTLTMVFLRGAAPLLLLLIAALQVKDSFLLLVAFASMAIVLLIAFKAITLNDFKALSVAVTGMAGRISTRPTIV